MQCHAWGHFGQRCRQEQQQTHDTGPSASVMFFGSVQALCPDTIPAPMMERYSPSLAACLGIRACRSRKRDNEADGGGRTSKSVL